MKTKTIFVICILSIAATVNTFADIAKKKIYLSPDHSKVSIITITEIYEPGRCIITYDTIKNYFPSATAKPHLNDSLAEALVNSSTGRVQLEEFSVYPYRIFGQDEYIIGSLCITDNQIFYKEASEYRVPKGRIVLLSIFIIGSIVFLLIIFLVQKDRNAQIKKIRLALIIGFASIVLICMWAFKISDIVILSTILILPAFLLTFAFQKRQRKFTLMKKGYDMDNAKIYPDGRIRVTTSKDDSLVLWLDKRYRYKNVVQDYDRMYEVKDGIRWISKTEDTHVYFGLIDKDMNIILKPVYEYIGKFNEGIATVKYKGLWTYYKLDTRNFILQAIYIRTYPFENGKGLVEIETGNKEFYDKKGNKIPWDKLSEEERKKINV